jgi:hypothetical protein
MAIIRCDAIDLNIHKYTIASKPKAAWSTADKHPGHQRLRPDSFPPFPTVPRYAARPAHQDSLELGTRRMHGIGPYLTQSLPALACGPKLSKRTCRSSSVGDMGRRRARCKSVSMAAPCLTIRFRVPGTMPLGMAMNRSLGPFNRFSTCSCPAAHSIDRSSECMLDFSTIEPDGMRSPSRQDRHAQLVRRLAPKWLHISVTLYHLPNTVGFALFNQCVAGLWSVADCGCTSA